MCRRTSGHATASMILAVVERAWPTRAVVLVAASDGAVRADRRDWHASGRRTWRCRPTTATSPTTRRAGPGAAERDIFILDAHTGNRWPLEASPGEDVAPFWTPDGRGLVFLSDRNRNPSMWMAPVDQGRLQGPPRLLKDGVGRVFLRGFTAAGAMHYDLTAGFAEVHVASIDGTRPLPPEPMSPRRAVSNFYPKWSPDGRFVAYAGEGSDIYATQARRELWIYDTAAGGERRVPFDDPIGRPIGWSHDSREILAGGQRLVIVDRESGRSRVIASDHEGQTAWGPAGVLLGQKGQIVLVDPANGQTMRTLGPQRDSTVSPDGRSVLWKRPTGRLAHLDVGSGQVREWADAVEWIDRMHFMAPHTSGVAYVAGRKGVNGESRSLMYWGGAGDPRELLRVSGSDQFMLAGWLPDDLTLLVVRFALRPGTTPDQEPRNETLWRVPITGEPPVSTGLTMEGLRDVSIHPDGRRVAFNAGWKRGEPWVMENVLGR